MRTNRPQDHFFRWAVNASRSFCYPSPGRSKEKEKQLWGSILLKLHLMTKPGRDYDFTRTVEEPLCSAYSRRVDFRNDTDNFFAFLIIPLWLTILTEMHTGGFQDVLSSPALKPTSYPSTTGPRRWIDRFVNTPGLCLYTVCDVTDMIRLALEYFFMLLLIKSAGL